MRLKLLDSLAIQKLVYTKIYVNTPACCLPQDCVLITGTIYLVLTFVLSAVYIPCPLILRVILSEV